LENLDGDVDDNTAWETIRENIKISAKRVSIITNLSSRAMVRRRMFKTVGSKATSQTVLVTEAKTNGYG
jgi:hypothetical protein